MFVLCLEYVKKSWQQLQAESISRDIRNIIIRVGASKIINMSTADRAVP